jgi:hypothetical protein
MESKFHPESTRLSPIVFINVQRKTGWLALLMFLGALCMADIRSPWQRPHHQTRSSNGTQS